MKNIFFTQYINEAFDKKALRAHRDNLISNYVRQDPPTFNPITKEKVKMLAAIRNEMGLFHNNVPSPVWDSFGKALINYRKNNPEFVKKILTNEETARRFISLYVQRFRRDIESTSGYLGEKLKTH